MRNRFGILLTAFSIAATAAWSADSPMFRGNAAHSGVYDGPAITAAPATKWKFHIDGAFIASPALFGGVLYEGGTDGVMHAVDAATGTEKWKFATDGRIVSSAAVANGVVYFESYDSNLYAVDAASGTLKWKFKTGGEKRFSAKNIHGIEPASETMPDPFDFYLSSPVVADGKVYFGSGDGNVYALDTNTGAVVWKFATGNVVHSSPAIADGMLFIGSWDTYLYALDAATGHEKWRFKTGDDEDIHNQTGIQGSPTIADSIVYFGCRDSQFYALSEKTGTKLWSYDNKGSWVIATPSVARGTVYMNTSDTGLFHALDAKTGAERFQISSDKWPMFSSPAVVNNMVYVGTHSGALLAIDTAKKAVAWRFQTDGAKANAARYTGPDGKPAQVNFENFYDVIVARQTRMSATGAILASPVAADGVLYVASMDGNLYALTR